MTAQPSPPDPSKLAADVASLGSSASSGGSLYGTSADVLAATFNVAGLNALPGLSGSKAPTGKGVLQAFLAAGQSPDPDVRNLVASIEYALYQGGYYTSGSPNLHSVTGHDAEALGKALLDLSQVDQTTVGATTGGQLQGMSVTQFLTSQAALAATAGPGAPGSAASKTTVIRTPNPSDVAAEYERVATSVYGKKPSAAETQAFVRQFIQQSVASATGATAAKYQAAVGQAAASQQTAPNGYMYTQGDSANAAEFGQQQNPPSSGTAPYTYTQGDSAGAAEHDLAASTPDTSLEGAMATLQDVIGANANTTLTEPQGESVDTAAQNFARNAHPGRAAANDIGNTMDMFFNIIRGVGQ